jgi:protein KRI1
MATDQELNEYMSVKKYAPYRQDKSNPQRWNKKTQDKLHELKAKVGERAGTSFIDGSRGQGRVEEKAKKRKGKKERMKLKAGSGDGDVDGAADAEMGEMQSSSVEQKVVEGAEKRSKKRKRDSKEDQGLDKDKKAGLHANREDNSIDDGENARKKRKKRKKNNGREAPTQQL